MPEKASAGPPLHEMVAVTSPKAVRPGVSTPGVAPKAQDAAEMEGVDDQALVPRAIDH